MVKIESKKGTTTLGLVCKDGVILAADKRASLGHLAMHKNVEKVLKITDHIGITTAGMVGDAQKLYDYLKAELQLYLLEKEEEPTVEVAAKLLSNILYEGRKSFIPYGSWFLVAGKSENGGYKVASLDNGGSVIFDNIAGSGSGMEMAYGVLDDHYNENISTSEAKKIAVKAISSSLKRDVFSGDGIDVVIINNDGYTKLTAEEVAKLK